MRVITGVARGRRLQTLEGLDVRPTADRVKEAAFSSIQFEIEGRAVLDLFAGSGQLGIEALSRGAKSAVFVDANPEAVRVTKENLTATGLFAQASVASGDFEPFLLHTHTVFDIVFIDPPYSRGLAARALELAAPHVSENGVVVCETAKGDPMPETAGELALARRAEYGKTALLLYRRP